VATVQTGTAPAPLGAARHNPPRLKHTPTATSPTATTPQQAPPQRHRNKPHRNATDAQSPPRLGGGETATGCVRSSRSGHRKPSGTTPGALSRDGRSRPARFTSDDAGDR
jgi:hypothetical protein